MNEKQIRALVEQSKEPLADTRLEDLQKAVHGTPHRYVRFLYLLCLELRPMVALELGTQWGVTSEHLCAAAATYGGWVIGVDQSVDARCKARNYDHLKMHSMAALPTVTRLVKAHGNLGLVFQDTGPEAREEEWEGYSKLLTGVWVANDADLMKFPWSKKLLFTELFQGRVVGVRL